MSRRLWRAPLAGVSLALAAAAPVSAESLADAIALAYRSNPSLQSQRYQLKATDEGAVQAEAGYRPVVGVELTAEYQKSTLGPRNQAAARFANPNAPSYSESSPGQGQVTLSQPLYTGGRVAAEVRAADAAILAGREALRATESDVLLTVIQAYVGVQRDQESLHIHETNLEALSRQLAETQARKRAGEVTLTDVAQAEAQIAAERALYASAQAQLAASRIAFAAAVGDNPQTLDPAPPLVDVPKTIDEAFAVAEANDPDLQQAVLSDQSAKARVAAARAANRPTLSLRSSYGYTGPAVPYDRRDVDRSITAEALLSVPLFTGGMNSSMIRQALDQEASVRVSIEGTRRAVVQNVANAWNQMVTARSNVATQETQVAAATTAYKGMAREYRVGQRSTLDVLIAEETLRDAELALAAAKHDAYVGEAAVLRYVGRLEARVLLQNEPLYDPAQNLRAIRRVGAVPWEGVVKRLDATLAPGAGAVEIVQPAELTEPPRSSPAGSDQHPSEVVQTIPLGPRDVGL